MNDFIKIIVSGNPEPKPSVRNRVVTPAGRKPFAHMYTPSEGPCAAWRRNVLAAAKLVPGFPDEPWEGGVLVTIEAVFERPKYMLTKKYPDGLIRKNSKPDSDNLVKAVLDALTPPRAKIDFKNEEIKRARRRGYLWVDDAQVHLGSVNRWYAAKGCGPGVEITAQRLKEAE